MDDNATTPPAGHRGKHTTQVDLAKEDRLKHEAELAADTKRHADALVAANQKRDDQRAYVREIFNGFGDLVTRCTDGVAKLIPRAAAGCGLVALIGLAAFALYMGVPIALSGFGVDVSTITTGTTVTTTDGATTTTSGTVSTTTGPTPDPAPPAPAPEPAVVPRREDTDAP